MEAMAFALPVVSTRLSGIPELVKEGETGLLTEAGDSAAIADALMRFAKDPAMRKAFGEAGRRRVEDEFELNANAAKLAALFREA
jgi:glycosyltransferase involved in cell wall biosynthesis